MCSKYASEGLRLIKNQTIIYLPTSQIREQSLLDSMPTTWEVSKLERISA